MLIISFPPTLLPCTIWSLLSMLFDWFLLGLDTCLIRRDLKLRSDANVTLFLHPFVSVNISETDTGKNNGIHLSSKVTICIYVQDFALVCVLYFSLCVTSHVTLCPWPVCLGFWGVCLLLFSSQSLGYFPECGPLQKLWGFINFLSPCLWLSVTTLDNSCVRILFLLLWGKQLLSFSVRY